MYLCVKKCKCTLFADDSTIYETDLISDVQNDMKIIIDWFYANKLTIHISKTVCILFKPTRKNTDIVNSIKFIDIENERVPLSKHVADDGREFYRRHWNRIFVRFESFSAASSS